MKMPAVEALAASKLRKAQLMPNRNRGCALAPWDNCILCAANPTCKSIASNQACISFENIVMGH
jgi:hypothetical protein